MARARKGKDQPTEIPQEYGRTENYSYCSLPAVAERTFSPDVHPDRMSLILLLDRKWVNGTVLHYYFFDKETDGKSVLLSNGQREFRKWTTSNAEKEVVRKAFKAWKDVGVGLSFAEVSSRDEAEIRIGFMRGDGAWSYIGRDIIDLNVGPSERTMNFGWDLTRSSREIDTAVHEIGHTLGFPHEHQNPNGRDRLGRGGRLSGAGRSRPTSGTRDMTYHNIIRKIKPRRGAGIGLGPQLGHALPVRAGPDQGAGAVPGTG